MSPVAGRGQSNTRTTVLVAIGAVVAAGALLLLVVAMSDKGKVELRIGDERFNAGDVGRISREIDDRGPILYSDVGGGQRDIYVHHIGDDAKEGWIAFDARQLDAERACTLEWDVDEGAFRDPCDGSVISADGGDLPHYTATVEEGDVLVDLAS